MRKYGWTIGFILAWATSIVYTADARVDLLFPFAVGGMAFSGHGGIVAGLWLLDGLAVEGIWLPRLGVIVLIQILLLRQVQPIHLYATAAAIPYSLLMGIPLSVALPFSFVTFMILQSGREKLTITPTPILKKGRILHEDCRDRSWARTPRPGNYEWGSQRGPHRSRDVLEAGRIP